ncbi:GNAT family N-acetyltransferase [Ereboglobus sp. PH5-5]|uniref:GNAT family N-acetyltransferase n=2 Tax=unclassified Ereboglobus TaxID=2626932 RepID=UPI00240590CC|nr:GNAT family N-acetyltransferase [Ereboglobus sp. PH5-5]
MAETSDGIIGFADVTLPAATPSLPDAAQAEITRLYVLERFTRQGVGSRLLRHATGHAFAAGATAVWLSAWAGNQRAIDFYKKHNWLHVGETSFMLGAVAHPNHIFAIRKSQQRRGCAPRAGLPDSPHPG